MARENTALAQFNRGIISELSLARVDVKRIQMSAEEQRNWMPRIMGPMQLRAGLQWLGSVYVNQQTRMIPFVFATDDTALVEITNSAMRVWVNDAVISRPSVSSLIVNGAFDTDVTSWTDLDEAGATSQWAAGGYLQMSSNGTAYAIREQAVTVSLADRGIEHAIGIHITQGEVVLRVGLTSGADDLISETTLVEGYHSLALTPTGDFTVQLRCVTEYSTYVDYCVIEVSGDMVITSPWATANLDYITYDQSGDIIFVSCKDLHPYEIQRRATRSWSVVKYLPLDGPFRALNTKQITLTPSAIFGDITLTASKPIFKSTNVGSLYKIESSGQTIANSLSSASTFTDTIRIVDVSTARSFGITISGTWTGTLILQRSFDLSTWITVTGKSWTANTSETYTDGLDNQIVYYRIFMSVWGSGTADIVMSYGFGSITGVVRVTAYTSATLVNAIVLSDLGGVGAVQDWYEGAWSTRRGFPSAVALADGRLAFAGKNGIWFSASDDFYTHNDQIEGDAAPISRVIGSGPMDTINWILTLSRIILGAQGSELAARGSTSDEPITPTNFSIKPASTQGSASVLALKIDKRGIFVQRGGRRVFELALQQEDLDYGSTDLTILCPDIGYPRIVRAAVQRQPDTRIHTVLSDGTVAVGVVDRAENVLAWIKVNSPGASGLVEDVVVTPGAAGTGEDNVYYVVNRTIGGATVRYFEKWALESDCQGGTFNKQADSFITYSGVATDTITGLGHLEGQQVVVWADGEDVGTETDEDGVDTLTYTVSGGRIVLAEPASSVVVGLWYDARFKSAKMAYAQQLGTGLTMRKIIDGLGLIMHNVHSKGLRFGPSFTTMDLLPFVKDGAAQTTDTVYPEWDEDQFEFPGEWDSDARLCLEARAPRPVTIIAAVVPVESHT